MPFKPSTISSNDGASHLAPLVASVSNPSGATGVAVTLNVPLPAGMPPTPSDGGRYVISALPSQPCFVSVSSRSTTGLTIVLTPMNNTTAIVAGFVDVIIQG
jgi:hypothetical protein